MQNRVSSGVWSKASSADVALAAGSRASLSNSPIQRVVVNKSSASLACLQRGVVGCAAVASATMQRHSSGARWWISAMFVAAMWISGRTDDIQWETVLAPIAGTVAISEASPADSEGLSTAAMLVREPQHGGLVFEQIRLVYVDATSGGIAETPAIALSQYASQYAVDGISVSSTITDRDNSLFTAVSVQWSGKDRSSVPVGGCAPNAQSKTPPYAMQMAVVRRAPGPARSKDVVWQGTDRQSFGVGSCALSADAVVGRLVLVCARGFDGGLAEDETLSSVFVAQLNASSTMGSSLSQQTLQVPGCACGASPPTAGCSLGRPLLLPASSANVAGETTVQYATGAVLAGGSGLEGAAMALGPASLQPLPGVFPALRPQQAWSVMQLGRWGAGMVVVVACSTDPSGGGWQVAATAWQLRPAGGGAGTSLVPLWASSLLSGPSGACPPQWPLPRADARVQGARLQLSASAPGHVAAVLVPSAGDSGPAVALLNASADGPPDRAPLALVSRVAGERRADDVAVGGGGAVSAGWLNAAAAAAACGAVGPQNGVFVDLVLPGSKLLRLWTGCPSLGGFTRANATLRILALGSTTGDVCLITLSAYWHSADSPLRGTALFAAPISAPACSGLPPLPSPLPTASPTPSPTPTPSVWPSQSPSPRPDTPSPVPTPKSGDGAIVAGVSGAVGLAAAIGVGLYCWRRQVQRDPPPEGYVEVVSS